MKANELETGKTYRYIGGGQNLYVVFLGLRAGLYQFASAEGIKRDLTEKSVENLMENLL